MWVETTESPIIHEYEKMLKLSIRNISIAFDNFFISLNHQTFVVATHIYRYQWAENHKKKYNFKPQC